MVKVSFSIQMEIIMRGIGAIIKHAVMVFTSMKTEINTKVNGRMMFSTDTEKKDGQTDPAIKDRIIKELNME